VNGGSYREHSVPPPSPSAAATGSKDWDSGPM